MYQQIIDRATNTSPTEELVAAIAACDAMKAAFEAVNIEVPEKLVTSRKRIFRQIEVNRLEETEAKRKEILSRLSTLKTAAEKRAELEAELAKLGN